MDLDDMLEDELELEQLDHEQALISKQPDEKTNFAYSINRNYINSKAYRDKFEKLPVGEKAKKNIYENAGRLLEFINNLPKEDMEEERLVAVSSRTGELIVDNFNRKGDPKRTTFEGEELKKYNNYEELITLLHNHSHNGRPSGQDLLSFLHNEKVNLSIILCHNGDVYVIYDVKSGFEEKYNEFLKETAQLTTDRDEAKRIATTKIYYYNNQRSDRHKLFHVEEL